MIVAFLGPTCFRGKLDVDKIECASAFSNKVEEEVYRPKADLTKERGNR